MNGALLSISKFYALRQYLSSSEATNSSRTIFRFAACGRSGKTRYIDAKKGGAPLARRKAGSRL